MLFLVETQTRSKNGQCVSQVVDIRDEVDLVFANTNEDGSEGYHPKTKMRTKEVIFWALEDQSIQPNSSR